MTYTSDSSSFEYSSTEEEEEEKEEKPFKLPKMDFKKVK
jgi:hypothetical protein